MPSFLRLHDDRYALATERIRPASDAEGGDVSVQRLAGLDVTVDFYIDRVAQQGPSVPGVVLDIVTGVALCGTLQVTAQ